MKRRQKRHGYFLSTCLYQTTERLCERGEERERAYILMVDQAAIVPTLSETTCVTDMRSKHLARTLNKYYYLFSFRITCIFIFF